MKGAFTLLYGRHGMSTPTTRTTSRTIVEDGLCRAAPKCMFLGSNARVLLKITARLLTSWRSLRPFSPNYLFGNRTFEYAWPDFRPIRCEERSYG